MINYPVQGQLPQLQEYVQKKCQERGFDSATNLETYLLFTEEIGEMAKAMRNVQGLFQENSSADTANDSAELQKKRTHLGEEMADVLSYLLDLANRYGVDLNEAFKAKEAINEQRVWK